MPSPTLTCKQEHFTLVTAHRFGSIFMRRLAEAGIFADAENRARIFSQFPELIWKYGPQSRFYSED
jgi:galactose-1-phosphate uridylyltransferase